MALQLVYPVSKTLVTVASTSTTATSANFSIPIADSYTFFSNISAATGTMDQVLQTSLDQGTTYVNVPWRFATNAATAGVMVLNVRSGIGSGNDVTLATGNGGLVIDTAGSGALALQCVIDPRFMKIKYTITTGPYAFILYVLAWPRGATVGVD